MTKNILEKRLVSKSIVALLKSRVKMFRPTLMDVICRRFGKDPYLILISCLLSLRSKDVVTIDVCLDLFSRIRCPEDLMLIPRKDLETILFKVGFYKRKSAILYEVSNQILNCFSGNVPSSLKDLLSLKGVGLKTANLVLGIAFDIPSICVDTHVHRISNRLGLVDTNNPDKTHDELKTVIDKESWIAWNNLLVVWGQNVCVPINPKCFLCNINSICKFFKNKY